jgi:hypothetical protein
MAGIRGAELSGCKITSKMPHYWQIMAITGHQTAKEVDRYTKGARQKELAASAMAKWEQGQNE